MSGAVAWMRRLDGVIVAMLAVGLLIRLVMVLTVDRDDFDLTSMGIFYQAVKDHGLSAYSSPDLYFVGEPRWPYPPGFLPGLGLASGAAGTGGIEFNEWVRLPGVFADLGIALLVNAYLGLRRYGTIARRVAAALIVFGPLFVFDAAWQGQLDSLTILPAVAAVVVWASAPPERRALWAGLLIGLAASIKGVPLLALFGLAPLARSWREAATLVGSAVAIPVLAMAPFALADPSGIREAFNYSGAPGVGGLSVVLQPDLALNWYSAGGGPDASGLVTTLGDASPVLVLLALAGVAAVARGRDLDPAVSVSAVWLCVYVFGVNFFLGYLVWGVPFFLMAGALRTVAAIELAWIVPVLFRYFTPELTPGDGAIRWLYVPVMDVLWLVAAVALVMCVVRIRRAPMRAPGEATEGLPSPA